MKSSNKVIILLLIISCCCSLFACNHKYNGKEVESITYIYINYNGGACKETLVNFK